MSLNTIMVDGTGMCDGCRVNVGKEVKFVCVDGPEFDAHQVDFDNMIYRFNAYKVIDKEIETLAAMGVEIKTNFLVGNTRKLTDLIDKDGYDAVFIGTGASLPIFMGIEGENLNGVFSADEYLTRINMMNAYNKNANSPIFTSKKEVMPGGGNVAIYAARIARQLGAENLNSGVPEN